MKIVNGSCWLVLTPYLRAAIKRTDRVGRGLPQWIHIDWLSYWQVDGWVCLIESTVPVVLCYVHSISAINCKLKHTQGLWLCYLYLNAGTAVVCIRARRWTRSTSSSVHIVTTRLYKIRVSSLPYLVLLIGHFTWLALHMRTVSTEFRLWKLSTTLIGNWGQGNGDFWRNQELPHAPSRFVRADLLTMLPYSLSVKFSLPWATRPMMNLSLVRCCSSLVPML
jgi:hypothetical protein